ncbi:uncharacterized protein UV8b_00869 [Ustilaginoidea virens]|uniref:Uncharacterized protein n=1 Tax=Ustilaginoidea virens TaxID=1159556 RepID=A0A8E5HJV6_USTVR|nr:uncharacterized protein UV8b_00869 [Ustilaginoidea virens]QUC16628.1 hypothetical protein UV8b_00869 [Ustilaginoidea virens]
MSAVLALSAVSQAAVNATAPTTTSSLIFVPLPLSTGQTIGPINSTTAASSGLGPYVILSASSGSPVPSGNSTAFRTFATGLPPTPTAAGPTADPTAGPTASNTAVNAGATLSKTQNSWLVVGLVVAMATLNH